MCIRDSRFGGNALDYCFYEHLHLSRRRSVTARHVPTASSRSNSLNGPCAASHTVNLNASVVRVLSIKMRPSRFEALKFLPDNVAIPVWVCINYLRYDGQLSPHTL